VNTLYIAPPEPEPLPKVVPEETIVWRRRDGESALTITTTSGDLAALEPGSIMVPIERRYVGIDHGIGPDRTEHVRIWARWAKRNARAPRGRRSRQNRSTRERGARRLAIRCGRAPATTFPSGTITLGGYR
jgi:hypothetical protein